MISRILIVGHGSIGRRHLRIARELFPQNKIAVLRHKISRTVPEYADYTFSTITEAVEFAPQIAVIANPATFHLSVAIDLAKIGTHLLIEKPLSTTTKDVAELLDVCQKRKVRLATGYNLRFLPSLQKFKSMLDDNKVGTVWSVRSEIGQFLPSWRPDSDYRQSVSAQSVLGGGALLELSHELDYLRWIFGELASVQASLSKQSDLEVDVEDTAHLILGFAEKADKHQLIASVNLDFIRQDTTRLCTAIGKLGSLRWDGISGTIELYEIGSQAWEVVYQHQPTRDESYMAEWLDLVNSIEKKKEPFVSGEDGLKVLQIIEAVRLSAKTGSRVDLDDAHLLRGI
ncbi:MAG: putative dehydrogenase [Psychroserpens sp.]